MAAYHLHIDKQVHGPYSETEVKTRIETGAIRPDSWVSVDGGDWERLSVSLPHLFVDPAGPEEVGLEPTDSPGQFNPYQPPRTSVEPVMMQENLVSTPFGGIGRLGFLASFVCIACVGGLLSAVTQGGPIATFLTAGVLLIPVSSRLTNIGRNPAWCFLMLIPLLGLFISLPCFFLPEGYEKHRKLDLPAKIMGGVFFALFIFLIVWAFTRM
jgi:hypothetical protein